MIQPKARLFFQLWRDHAEPPLRFPGLKASSVPCQTRRANWCGSYRFPFPESERGGSQVIMEILSSLGFAKEVGEERDVDRVTAISGSGPAMFLNSPTPGGGRKDIGLEPG